MIDEDCIAEVLLDCALSSVEVTSIVPALVLDFIRSMITVVNPIREISKATPRQAADMTAGLDMHSVLLPDPIIYYNNRYAGMTSGCSTLAMAF